MLALAVGNVTDHMIGPLMVVVQAARRGHL